MDFLLEYGMTSDDVEQIVSRNQDGIIKNIVLNKNNVIDVINYLKEIGLNDSVIKEMFLYQIGMFFRTKDEIRGVFDEYEMDSILKSMNYDVNTVDMIEFS